MDVLPVDDPLAVADFVDVDAVAASSADDDEDDDEAALAFADAPLGPADFAEAAAFFVVPDFLEDLVDVRFPDALLPDADLIDFFVPVASPDSDAVEALLERVDALGVESVPLF